MPDPAQVDVFVSYAKADQRRVAPLVAALESCGWQVWWDAKLGGGSVFDREIEAALTAARCVVVVWSRESVESDWVRAEASEGLERGVLIPVALDRVRAPLVFRRTQAIDVTDEGGTLALIDAVARFVPPRAAASPAAMKSPRPPYALATVVASFFLLAVIGWWLWPRAPDPPQAVVPERIAVMPFEVRGGSRLDYLREGMVDLLATRLDGLPGMHGSDPLQVLTLARRRPEAASDPAVAAEVAQAVGAGRFIMGSVVESGNGLSLSASLRERGREPPGVVSADVALEEDLIAGVDELTRRIVSGELDAPYESFARLAVLTTDSHEALRTYLEAERLFRAGEFQAAVHRFQEATRLDAEFALAWFRLSIAATLVDRDLVLLADARADALKERLTVPHRELLRAYRLGDVGRVREAERVMVELTNAYPDEVEMWRFLGEIRFRTNPFFGRDRSESIEAFQRIIAVDPTDAWARRYLMDLALLVADPEAVREHARFLGREAQDGSTRAMSALADYLAGAAELDAVVERLAADPPALLAAYALHAPFTHDPELMLGVTESVLRLRDLPRVRAAMGVIGAATGDWSRVYAAGWDSAEERLIFAILTTVGDDVPQDLVERALLGLSEWDPGIQGLQACADPHVRAQGCSVELQQAARYFYLEALERRLGRLEQAADHADALGALASRAESDSLIAAFAATAAGWRALQGGDPAMALVALERGRVGPPFLALASGPADGLALLYQPLMAWNRWLTATALRQQERPGEARRWERSVAQSGFWYVPWHRELNRLRRLEPASRDD